MPKFQQTLKSKPLLQITKSTNQRLANGIAVAIVQLRIARMEKNNVQELGRKDCTHYRRLAGHWRCNREAFGPRTERTWPSHTRKVPTRPPRLLRRLNASAERRSQFRRTPLMPVPSKPRSKR